MSYSPQHLDRLRLRHLRLLDLIDRHRSLRAVAGILNLTQPAVSQMVKDLEQAFGVPLVDRSARGVTLNPAGRQALQRARPGLASIDYLASELHADPSVTVRIGANPAMMFRVLPKALGKVYTDPVRMRFIVGTGMVGTMMKALLDGDLDCYIGRVDWDQVPKRLSAALYYHPLAQTELVVACSASHPLAGRGGLAPKDLEEWPWVLPAAESNNRVELEAGLRNHGLGPPRPAVEVSADLNAAISVAREMELLIVVARMALEMHVAAGELRVLDIPALQLPPIQIGFLTLLEHQHMAPLPALREALAETFESV